MAEGEMDRQGLLRLLDGTILFCLCVLAVFLPIAHTETVRAFALGIPGALMGLKMILARRFIFARTPLDGPILLFSLAAGLSVVLAVDPLYSLRELIGEWVLCVCLFYLTVNNVRAGQVKYLLGALLLGNGVMAGYGIFDFFRDGGRLLDFQIRAQSLHSGFGTFSTYLVTLMPYILAAILFVKGRFPRALLLLLLCLNVLALFLTHSRGAWVAAAFLMGAAGWMAAPKKILIPLGAAAVAGVLFLAPQEILFHTISIPGPGAPGGRIETGDARWEVAKFSLGKIKENPFQMLGYGRRSFVKQYDDFYRKYQGALLWHAHNTFLNVTLQTGIVGLAIFLFLLYKLLRFSWQRSRLEPSDLGRFYALATFFMVIAFFIRNLSDDFFVDDSALMFWLLCGGVFGIAAGSEEGKNEH